MESKHLEGGKVEARNFEPEPEPDLELEPEIFQAADFDNKDKLRNMYKLLNNALDTLNSEEYGGLKVSLYKDHIKVYLE